MVNCSYNLLGGPCIIINIVNIIMGKELIQLVKLYYVSKLLHYPSAGLQRDVPLAGGAFSFLGMGTGTFSSGFLGISGTLKIFSGKFKLPVTTYPYKAHLTFLTTNSNTHKVWKSEDSQVFICRLRLLYVHDMNEGVPFAGGTSFFLGTGTGFFSGTGFLGTSGTLKILLRILEMLQKEVKCKKTPAEIILQHLKASVHKINRIGGLC